MKHFTLLLSLTALSAITVWPFVERAKAQNRTTTLGGYELRSDGYYWKGGVAYVGTKKYHPVTYYTDSYGIRYANPQQYHMEYVLAPVTPPTAPKTADWRSTHSLIAREIARGKTTANLLAIDSDAYLKSLDKLKEMEGQTVMTGQLGQLGYGLGLPFQGNTVYAPSGYGNYSVNRIAQQFMGTFDVNVAMATHAATAKLLIQGAQEVAKANMELTAIAIDAAKQIALANGPSFSARGQSVAGIGVVAGASAPIQQLLNASCVKCHSGDKPKGGLILSNYNIVTLVQWDKILDRIEPEVDPTLRMPLDAPALSGAERRIIKDHVKAIRQRQSTEGVRP